MEFRIIDCYEASGEGLPHYVKYLQSKPYVYGRHFFPHDAGSGNFQTGKSIQNLATDLGLKTIVLLKTDLEVGIEMADARPTGPAILLKVCRAKQPAQFDSLPPRQIVAILTSKKPGRSRIWFFGGGEMHSEILNVIN